MSLAVIVSDFISSGSTSCGQHLGSQPDTLRGRQLLLFSFSRGVTAHWSVLQSEYGALQQGFGTSK